MDKLIPFRMNRKNEDGYDQYMPQTLASLVVEEPNRYFMTDDEKQTIQSLVEKVEELEKKTNSLNFPIKYVKGNTEFRITSDMTTDDVNAARANLKLQIEWIHQTANESTSNPEGTTNITFGYYNEALWTGSSWEEANLNTVLINALSVANNSSSGIQDVIAEFNNIFDSIDKLVIAVDRSALNATMLTALKVFYSEDTANTYNSPSINALWDTYCDAKVVYNNAYATQEIVDYIRNSLEVAYNASTDDGKTGLVGLYPLDYVKGVGFNFRGTNYMTLPTGTAWMPKIRDDARNQIAWVKNEDGKGNPYGYMDSSLWTASSWASANLSAVLSAATTIVNNARMQAPQWVAEINKIFAAIEKLKTAINKDALATAINTAISILNDPNTNITYTKASVDALWAEYYSAKKVQSDTFVTQSDVDAATEAIIAAYTSGLEEKVDTISWDVTTDVYSAKITSFSSDIVSAKFTFIDLVSATTNTELIKLNYGTDVTYASSITSNSSNEFTVKFNANITALSNISITFEEDSIRNINTGARSYSFTTDELDITNTPVTNVTFTLNPDATIGITMNPNNKDLPENPIITVTLDANSGTFKDGSILTKNDILLKALPSGLDYYIGTVSNKTVEIVLTGTSTVVLSSHQKLSLLIKPSAIREVVGTFNSSAITYNLKIYS